MPAALSVEHLTLPLFPLRAVLFPGGILPLRIFEPRYLQMVSTCLKTDTGFGVCRILDGAEVGQAAETSAFGTLARIGDWDRGRDGLLAVTAVGERRLRVLSRWVEPDQLVMARAELLPAEPEADVPAAHAPLADLLGRLLDQLPAPYRDLPRQGGAAWVAGRLAELLPLRLAEKQALLEMDGPIQRLEWLHRRLQGTAMLRA